MHWRTKQVEYLESKFRRIGNGQVEQANTKVMDEKYPDKYILKIHRKYKKTVESKYLQKTKFKTL